MALDSSRRRWRAVGCVSCHGCFLERLESSAQRNLRIVDCWNPLEIECLAMELANKERSMLANYFWAALRFRTVTHAMSCTPTQLAWQINGNRYGNIDITYLPSSIPTEVHLFVLQGERDRQPSFVPQPFPSANKTAIITPQHGISESDITALFFLSQHRHKTQLHNGSHRLSPFPSTR